ncbi:MAG TPA: hypothetical protein DCZ03_07425 [Gammaproteobacteria bacterium]|nr:hypothetical protein [Gammaproteobacteria bacterium]
MQIQFSHNRPHYAYLFAWYGLLVGMLFVLGCTLAQSWVQFDSFSLNSLWRTQSELHWFWIIDAIPFLVGLGAFYRGQHQDLLLQSRLDRQNFIRELERRNQELDVKVQEQTREIQNAMSSLERAYAAKSEFLAFISHELRTPVNGLMGFLDLLRDTELTHPQADYVDTAHHSGEHLLTLINNVLDFSKIESGHIELESTDFELRTMLEDVVDMVSPVALGKEIELSLLISSTVPQMIKGDPTRLRQILINLVNNAIKFTEEGEITISVSVETLNAKQAIIQFQVRDSGCGITSEAQAKIFDSFTQATRSTTRQFGGTGLGLAIAKQLTEMMEGKIGVRSQPEVGSTFWFMIPFELSLLSPPNFYPIQDLSGKRVLIFINNDGSRESISQQLKDWALEVSILVSKADLVSVLSEAAQQHRAFDLVLVDGYLSPQDLQQSREIKSSDEHHSKLVKLVNLASFGKRGDAKSAADAGYDAYLSKPVRRDQLRECLAALLNEDSKQPKQLLTKHRLAESAAQKENCILLVEDNEINQKVTQAMLNKLGYRVDVAHDGEEALKAIEKHAYVLILMDCYMPVMDGFEATKKIRCHPEHGNIPIIAASGMSSEIEQAKCLQSGMNDSLIKPIKIESLKSCLDKWLENEKEA